MNRRTVTRVAAALVLIALIAGIYMSPLRDHLNREDIRAFVENLRGLWYGPLVFIAVFAAACVVALPASIFVIASGLIWGWKLGGTWAMIGGIIGAVASFYAGRFIGEGLLGRFGRVGQLVIRQADHAGFKSLLILRFIPGIPFAALNYGAGVAGVRIGDFIAATMLGMAPSVYVFAYCADALFNGSMGEGDALLRLLIVGVLMIAIVLIPSLLRRRLRSVPDAEG